MAFLGSFGKMAHIRVSAESVTPSRESTVKTPIDGPRQVFTGARVYRSWAVSRGTARPAELAVLAGFVDGLFGAGPWAWMSDWALVTNALSPQQALFRERALPASAVASFAFLDGVGLVPHVSNPTAAPIEVCERAASIPAITGQSYTASIPAIDGQTYTASVYAIGVGVTVRLIWANAAGVDIALSTSAPVTSTTYQRVAVTATPPAGAVSCRPYIYNATKAEAIAVTLTTEPMPYGPGGGCPFAWVDGLSSDVIMAVADPDRGQMAAAAYTIMEV